jgi:hypothetical protein
MYTCIAGMRRQRNHGGGGHPVTQDKRGGWMGGGGEINGFMAIHRIHVRDPPPTPTPIPVFGSGVVGRGRGGEEVGRGMWKWGAGGRWGGRKGRLRGIGGGMTRQLNMW